MLEAVKLVDEHICPKGVKIQKWKGLSGFDIVVICDGIVKSTEFIKNETIANNVFILRVSQNEFTDIARNELKEFLK